MTDRLSMDRRRFLQFLGVGAGAAAVGGTAFGNVLTGGAAAASDRPEPRESVMVEMRDGVRLATDVYRPSGDGSYPTLVYRTPYGKDASAPVTGIQPAVERGFAVVVQDVRGRFASEGGADWEPVFEEGPDGYDTIEWAAAQPWSTGSVGMLGLSYMGMTTWLAAVEDPPSLEAILPQIPSWYDYDQLGYQSGGLLEMGNLLSWLATNSADTVARLDVSAAEKESLRNGLDDLVANVHEEGYEQLPLTDIPQINDVVPFWKRYLHHYTKDEYWNRVSIPQQIGSVSVPILHVGGWYDAFKGGMSDVYDAIESEADEDVRENHHMIMGPWTHLTYGTDATAIGGHEFGEGSSSQAAVAGLALDWFDHWLTDSTSERVASLPKVRYFQMGENEWHEADEWPPSPTRTDLYLNSGGDAGASADDGTLERDMPLERQPADAYTYDPRDPVPTKGGTAVLLQADSPGISDQSEVEGRSDVLVYSTPALDGPVSVAGRSELTLFVSSSAPDTDFTAKLVDVHPDGTALNVAEGGVRTRFRDSLAEPELMEPGSVQELSIRIRHTAHTFDAGHRIRLDVTSSNFPRFDRNPNTGVVPATANESDLTTADQRVYHDEDRPSRIALPVTEGTL
ncbi:putative CocE/NonD family hydrolase [Halarchaeum solikamskense]|uniref:CocE/NonD family hydrolase n=1 Tax=Halarchaeum nitratireducens TaxID=489913 RepID=UPI001B3AF2CD|nr:CocE/NonD family hydrolase [Halarchaeum solikamskense]MBP2251226.1 putative CocE/NonD family hydrolase [Halarchaeum solikamskense]